MGNGRSWMILPGTNHQHNRTQTKNQRSEGHDISDPVKALRGWRRQHCGTVLLHEALLDQAVAISPSQRRHEFVAHAVGRAAAYVVTLQKNLIASTDAQHLVADCGEPRSGIAGAKQ